MKKVLSLVLSLVFVFALAVDSYAACTQSIAISFIKELMEGKHSNAVAGSCTGADVPWDCCTGAGAGTSCGTTTWKIALYTTAAATFDYTSTVYSATGEVSGTGYSAGGTALSGFTVGSSTKTAWIDFTSDPSWSNSTITADCFIIYNDTNGDKIMMTGTFTSTSSTNGTFTVVFPTADSSNALLRITVP